MTTREVTQLSEQLAGAIAAIDLMKARVPHVVRVFFSSLNLVSTDDVSDHAKHALEELAEELRAARRQPAPTPVPSREALRLAYSVDGN